MKINCGNLLNSSPVWIYTHIYNTYLLVLIIFQNWQKYYRQLVSLSCTCACSRTYGCNITNIAFYSMEIKYGDTDYFLMYITSIVIISKFSISRLMIGLNNRLTLLYNIRCVRKDQPYNSQIDKKYILIIIFKLLYEHSNLLYFNFFFASKCWIFHCEWNVCIYL